MEVLTCFPIEEVDEVNESTPRHNLRNANCFMDLDDDIQPRSPPTPSSFCPFSPASSDNSTCVSLNTSASSQNLTSSVFDRLSMDSSRRQNLIPQIESLSKTKALKNKSMSLSELDLHSSWGMKKSRSIGKIQLERNCNSCLLYTSDAADE